MTIKVFAAALFGVVCLAPALCLSQSSEPELTMSRNSAGEVLASVSGMVPACGLTAIGDAPTFSIEVNTITVHQAVAGVACMNPPPKERRYQRTLNLGKLAAGTYTIKWNFPPLTATYTSSGN